MQCCFAGTCRRELTKFTSVAQDLALAFEKKEEILIPQTCNAIIAKTGGYYEKVLPRLLEKGRTHEIQ